MSGSITELPERPFSHSEQEVLDQLQVNRRHGLTSAEAQARLEHFGPNAMPEPKKEPEWLKFLRQFNDPLIYMLLASAVLTAFLGEWIDATVIFGVVFINAIIGYVQEGKSEKALEGIKHMLSTTASVKRDGAWTTLNMEDLVPGDIVRLQAGDRIPADLRLLREAEATAEESALTGESVPAEKDIQAVDDDAGIGDRTSMAFSSTMLASGTATGVVVATGAATEIGAISSMISNLDALETPLTRQISAFTKQLSLGTLIVAALLVLIGAVVHGQDLISMIMAGVGFAVAAIPEGLPALITITLALGVQTMAERNAITRKLPAVQTLGSVSVICSDKTGTLTKNEMTVVKGAVGQIPFHVSGTGYSPQGKIEVDGTAESLKSGTPEGIRALAYTVGLVNDTDLVHQEKGWTIAGEPTEGALVTFSAKCGVNIDRYARVATLPFSSDYKFMASTAEYEGTDMVLLKGAPDVLLSRSTKELTIDGAERDIDTVAWNRRVDELSSQGLRVLAAARRKAEAADRDSLSVDSIGENLTFLGIVGIVDPPRQEAIDAIKVAQGAGITVKMITGDHAGTASAIARQMGIDDGAAAVTGAELEKASDAELTRLALEHNVFSRTSPEHKLRLVRALQSQGHVVAMTGDGVNDSPALRSADVGVAMGIKGTEVTKDAADVVLADDDFATIEKAVEEGRRIYDNLRKAIVFLLVTNGAQALVMMLAMLLGWMLPLTPLQILWVNMVTAVTLAFAFAFEPAEHDIMQRNPEPKDAKIVSWRHIAQIAIASVVITALTMGSFYWSLDQGHPMGQSRTFATLVLVMGQVFYLFNVKFLETTSLRKDTLTNNKWAWIVVAILLILQAIYTYAPFMHTLFGSVALGWSAVGVSVLLGLVVFLVLESAKPLLYGRHSRR